MALLVAFPVHAASKTDPPAEAVRQYGTLRSAQVNLHTGPGMEFPLLWTYTRRDLPVEVLAKVDNWRKIREIDGTTGWVLQTMVSNRRGALVTGKENRALRRRPAADAAVEAMLEPGVVARIKSCDPGWCRLTTQGYDGWMKRDEFWGVDPGETIE